MSNHQVARRRRSKWMPRTHLLQTPTRVTVSIGWEQKKKKAQTNLPLLQPRAVAGPRVSLSLAAGAAASLRPFTAAVKADTRPDVAVAGPLPIAARPGTFLHRGSLSESDHFARQLGVPLPRRQDAPCLRSPALPSQACLLGMMELSLKHNSHCLGRQLPEPGKLQLSQLIKFSQKPIPGLAETPKTEPDIIRCLGRGPGQSSGAES